MQDQHFTPAQLRILTKEVADEIRERHRAKAHDALDSERDYQDSLDDTRTDHKDRSVGDYITMLGFYYQELLAAWTKNAGDNEALHVMRKIGGIAMHCMEDHGSFPRKTSVTTHY